MEWYFVFLIVLLILAGVVFIISVAAGIVAGNIVARPKGINRLTFEQVRRIQTKLGSVDYDAYDAMEKESFLLRREDGVELACEFLPNPEGAEKCLIYVHGFSQNRLIGVRFLSVFREMGYSALIFDQRGFGESGGFCGFGYFEKHDLAALVEWVRSRMGEDVLIGLVGESMGAITILESLDVLDGIAFAVPDSSCSSVYSMFSALTKLPAFPVFSIMNLVVRIRFGVNLKSVRPVDRVAGTDMPIMFMHGTADPQIKVSECPKLFAAARNPLSRMELFENSAHCMGHVDYTERYEGALREFVVEAERVFNEQ